MYTTLIWYKIQLRHFIKISNAFRKQEVTRSHKGWALDSVVLQNHITKLNREDVHEGPAEGVYVYGLFLEGKYNDFILSKRFKIT